MKIVLTIALGGAFSEHRRLFFVDYLFETIIETAENDAIMIADITDFDDDSMGDQIIYYLGGGCSQIKHCTVEDYDGLNHHLIPISDFSEMLKFEKLSAYQKQKLQKFCE